jgi:hypothetical protein
MLVDILLIFCSNFNHFLNTTRFNDLDCGCQISTPQPVTRSHRHYPSRLMPSFAEGSKISSVSIWRCSCSLLVCVGNRNHGTNPSIVRPCMFSLALHPYARRSKSSLSYPCTWPKDLPLILCWTYHRTSQGLYTRRSVRT